MVTQSHYTPFEMIEKLVSYDTTSRTSNLELIDFVVGYLAVHGVTSSLIHNDDKSKANLTATLGPGQSGGIVLSGHTDVVPVDGQDWSTDPFTPVNKSGRIYGRGTTDMKSFLAIALALVPEFLKRDLHTPIHLALSYDEEIGCLGAPRLVEHIVKHVPRPKLVVIGEPTDMKVISAHKGIHAFRTTVTGREAHSSATHKGVNAVMVAADLIGFIAKLAQQCIEASDSSSPFDPPYTTLQVGTITGGTALNIIAKSCTFDWEIRALPTDSPDDFLAQFNAHVRNEILPKLKTVSEEAHIETIMLAHVPAFQSRAQSDIESLMLMIAQQNETGAVSYGTEAGIFEAADIPTFVCGPGNIAQAHRPNEYIEHAQIDACTTFMHRLMDQVCNA